MSVMDTLITDRTQADVNRADTLNRKGWDNLTAAEQTEWESGLKGTYNAADLNRVGQAVEFLRDYLNGVQAELDAHRTLYGVASDGIFDVTWGQLALTVKTDWTTGDIPTPVQLTAYLQNVDDVSAAITITRHLPSGMDNLTVHGANEIERVLEAEYAAGLSFEADKKALIERTSQSWSYCGEVYCGELAADVDSGVLGADTLGDFILGGG